VRPAFASHDHPVNPIQIKRSEILKERFDGQETDRGGRPAERVDSLEAVASILNAYPEPDVRKLGYPMELTRQQPLHSIVPLGEYLVYVPISLLHHAAYLSDIGSWHSVLEKVAHRIDEDPSLLPPSKGLA
jgi:hypothetical protein